MTTLSPRIPSRDMLEGGPLVVTRSQAAAPSQRTIRVLLDIDGVCADFLGAASAIVEQVTGRTCRAEELPSWDIWDHVGREHEARCYELFRAEGFCANIQPYPGAVDGVRRLREVAEVRVVTSPIHGKHWYYERAEWCMRHLGIKAKDVMFTGHKEHVVGDILIDDRTLHVERWAAAHSNGIGIIWAQPYNVADAPRLGAKNIRRARSWDDVLATVEQMKGWGW